MDVDELERLELLETKLKIEATNLENETKTLRLQLQPSTNNYQQNKAN